MLEYITEKQNCFDYLKNSSKPIFIYGMGDGALKILAVFEKYGITCAGFFASDEFVRGHSFMGHLVRKLSDIEAEHDDFIIVLAFAAGYEKLYTQIREIAAKHEFYAPDVPVVTDKQNIADDLFTYEYCLDNAEKFDKVYHLLGDEISKKVFADVINFKISGKIEHLHSCTTERTEVFKEIIKLKTDDVYVDLGAYTGDTVAEFIQACNGKFKQIHAFEPNLRNFKKMQNNLSEENNVVLYNAGAWDTSGLIDFTDGEGRMTRAKIGGNNTTICYAVDEKIQGATLIKLDVEGAERRAILGAKNNISDGSNVITALYHRNEDMFDIPLLLHELNPNLKFYIRHHLYIPAWETNLYAVNK